MKKNSFNSVAIILARGGSKGISKKNIMPFCEKPLLEWTVRQLQNSNAVSSIWISSDDDEILELASSFTVNTIKRPVELSGDEATSESGLLHALNIIEESEKVDLIVHPQVTSPIRQSSDFSEAIALLRSKNLDSMFSACHAKDLCLWTEVSSNLVCVSYNRKNPYRRRQDSFETRWIENGSFYLISPDVLKKTGLRFGERLGIFPMDSCKAFEIDEPEDIKLCEVIMKSFILE